MLISIVLLFRYLLIRLIYFRGGDLESMLKVKYVHN